MGLEISHNFKFSSVNKVGEFFNEGSSVGLAKKFIGKTKFNEMGIVKFPIHKYSFDCVNELVVHEFCKFFGIKCCKVSEEFYKGEKCVMSHFFNDGIFTSCRNLVKTNDLKVFRKTFNMKFLEKTIGSEAVKDFIKMIFIDFLTRQTDRHTSNFGFINSGMYPLYDNGRCLFFEDRDNEIPRGNYNPLLYAVTNEHGYGYTYLFDHLEYLKDLPKLKYEDALKIMSKYYSKPRSVLLAEFVYKNYSELDIEGGSLNW